MRQWNYLQASFHTAQGDAASGILWALGTQGIEEAPLSKDKLRINAYFEPSCDIQSLQRQFKAECRKAGIRLLACSLRIQIERDWFRKWRQYLQPFTVGERFQIMPCESAPTSTAAGQSRSRQRPARSSRIFLYIEPGMAFGTGTHETTQLCIEALERHLPPGSTCLDVGTGSGILAMAAAKLGARRVVACDVDPVALEIAAANSARNSCGSRIRWVSGDIDRVKRCRPGCLVANLTVEIIEQEFEKFLERLQPGAVLILSGLLNRQVPRIEKLRRQSALRRKAWTSKGEWTCLIYETPRTSRCDG